MYNYIFFYVLLINQQTENSSKQLITLIRTKILTCLKIFHAKGLIKKRIKRYFNCYFVKLIIELLDLNSHLFIVDSTSHSERSQSTNENIFHTREEQS